MTGQGKESIALAVQEARGFGHHYIGTEHLPLGLLRAEEDIAAQLLRKTGVTVDEARTLIRQILVETEQSDLISEALRDTGYKPGQSQALHSDRIDKRSGSL
ncbi:MAG TPA: Clp protease N-terminal domain-containing protein [Ktedonobacteraceae bacterium]|nr:Clp protease N-terminal domain-containing protein [Ktedonobacteraceae bacterium]